MGNHASAPVPGGMTTVGDTASFCWPGHGFKCPDSIGFGGQPTSKHPFEQYNNVLLVCNYKSRNEAAETIVYTVEFDTNGKFSKSYSVSDTSTISTGKALGIGTAPDTAVCCGSDCNANNQHVSIAPTLPSQCAVPALSTQD